MEKHSEEIEQIICWWSGGVTSAVACKIAIDLFGIGACRIIFIDTKNEDDDTYRFKLDCEKWYGKNIEIITNNEYQNIEQVWIKFKSLNVANGAICSSELKRAVRLKFQRENPYKYQVFGFDIDEPKRAKAMTLNYPEANPVYPLLFMGYSKKKCIELLRDAAIEIPVAYKLGLNNNNCLKTGCVQGGIGYWQLMKILFPEKFNSMAAMEHELTNLKKKPVTMLRDQGKDGGLVFLKPHPDYPGIKDISMMSGRQPKPLLDCNGFCGTNDLGASPTQNELNFEKKQRGVGEIYFTDQKVIKERIKVIDALRETYDCNPANQDE